MRDRAATETTLDDLAALDRTDTLTRRVTVSPAMCGAGSLIFAQMGDWTWEAVNAACGTNVYKARSAAGLPAYLSFYYFRVSSSGRLHPNGLTFGDELDVTSRVFDVGSQLAPLTIHRISRADEVAQSGPLEAVEVFEQPRPDCIYVENFNRWIVRSDQNSNVGLVTASPVGYQHKHLTRLPAAYLPRIAAGSARKNQTFFPSGLPGFSPAAATFTTTYELDVVRDLNAVGLLYFASYFSIADTALLRAWRAMGREDRKFLDRIVLDYRLGLFGNADLGSVFDITVRILQDEREAGHEIADIMISEQGTGRILGVVGIRMLLNGRSSIVTG